MKNFCILLVVLAGIAGFSTACSDSDSESNWKRIPTEAVSGTDLTLMLNGVASTFGSAQMSVSSGTEAVLTLRNVVAGYAEVAMPVTLTEQPDGSYNYSGKIGLGAPKATRAEQTVNIFDVAVQGNVALDGKVSSAVVTSLTDAGKGGLSGTWPLSKDFYAFDEDGWPVDLHPNTPMQFTWSGLNPEAHSCEGLSVIAKIALTQVLAEVLSDVTLSADGNLTATYYPELITSKIRHPETNEWVNTVDYIRENTAPGDAEMDETTFWFTYKLLSCTTATTDPYTRQWLSSPKNLVTWYTSGDYIYILPNLAQILAQVSADQGGNSFDPQGILNLVQGFREMDDTKLKETLVMLGNGLLNIDLSNLDVALVRTVFDWLQTGVPLKYSVENGVLNLYVDKEMVKPYMEYLLTFMPLLDEKFQELAATDPTGMMSMIFFLLGFDNFTELQTIWAENTDVFQLGLCFKNTASSTSLKRSVSRVAKSNPVKWTDVEAMKRQLGIK